MPAPAAWTDDRVRTLSALWCEGLSASQIACRLTGVTRNAVIGKVHRLGIAGRGRPSAPAAPARPRPPVPRPAVRKPRSVMPDAQVPPRVPMRIESLDANDGVSILALTRGGCRWPFECLGSNEVRYCGRAAVRGAFCAEHGARAYRQTPKDHPLKCAGLG